MHKEGIANWNPLAWAKSLAVRRANGSVWGWNHRTRADHSDQNTVVRASSPLPYETLERMRRPVIRARTAEDELTLIDEEDYESYQRYLTSKEMMDHAMEDGMMIAAGSPGITRAGRLSRIGKTVVDTATDAVNSSRAVVTAYDLSAPFRQGGILALSRPTCMPRAYVNMLRAARSERAALAVMYGIKSRKYAELYKDSGLYLAESGEGAEEVFKAIFAHKIPGVNLSERAYNAYLNTVRADCFDALVDALKAASNKTMTKAGNAAYEKYLQSLPAGGFSSLDDALASLKGAQKSISSEVISSGIKQKELEAIANYINVATGRGSIGAAEKYAKELSTIFFAPKLTASRWQMLSFQPVYQGSARSRMIIAGEYGKYLAGLATLYGLAKMSGAQVTWDPRSTDFGKIRFGENRIDPLSGLGKHAVYAARVITGQFEGVSGKSEDIYDDKGRNNWDDITERYVRSTLSPLYGTAVTLATGRGIDGKPYRAEDIPYDLLPLSARDIYEQYRDNDPLKATLMSLATLHGAGIDTYAERVRRMTKAQVDKAIERGEAIDAASLYK
jgi:hypothetical protein